jgi:hypothetical protein
MIVNDCAIVLLKTKGPHFEGFWVSRASSNDGNALSTSGYYSRRRIDV